MDYIRDLAFALFLRVRPGRTYWALLTIIRSCSSKMRTAARCLFLSFCLCFTAVSAGKSSSSNRSDNYTKPLCDPDGFYCGDFFPVYYDCLSRTDRCTTLQKVEYDVHTILV